jgi:hypothetical protein
MLPFVLHLKHMFHMLLKKKQNLNTNSTRGPKVKCEFAFDAHYEAIHMFLAKLYCSNRQEPMRRPAIRIFFSENDNLSIFSDVPGTS